MPATPGASFLSWLTDHAVLLLALSVTITVVVDQLAAAVRRRSDVRGSVTSIAGGAAYLLAKGIVSKGLMFGVALAVYEHRLLDLDWTSPLVWLGIFVARDFAYYWIHRAEHRVRVLWASHLIHHSLERFTFTSAVRLPWMESLYKPVLVLWVPLLGFHPAAFAAMGALVLLFGQLQHTELGRRRTPLDVVFVTPSAHRVHHGSNAEYLDKNFGSMLIVWDRMFGTYAAETVPVRYGLAGGKRVATPVQALVGGYPALVASARAQGSLAAGGRYLVAAP
jgi:sterol desaturase/sphingolipid hydroxylase (fatty acid hydroxylase superfamily)